MEGKDPAGNTGTVSRRLKEKLAVEDIYGVEESEEVDTEKIEDCEIIDTEGNVIDRFYNLLFKKLTSCNREILL